MRRSARDRSRALFATVAAASHPFSGRARFQQLAGRCGGGGGNGREKEMPRPRPVELLLVVGGSRCSFSNQSRARFPHVRFSGARVLACSLSLSLSLSVCLSTCLSARDNIIVLNRFARHLPFFSRFSKTSLVGTENNEYNNNTVLCALLRKYVRLLPK